MTWKRDANHRFMSGHGFQGRSQKRSGSESPKKPRESTGGDGKNDFGYKKASRSKRHVRVSNSCSGSWACSRTRRLKTTRKLSPASDDDSEPPSLARDKFENLFQCHQINEERLERMESDLSRANALDEKEREFHQNLLIRFQKKLYEDQFSFNQSVVAYLRKALDSNDHFLMIRRNSSEFNSGQTDFRKMGNMK